MPSLKSRFFYLFARYGHLMRFQLHRDHWKDESLIPAFREQCESGAARTPMPAGVRVEPVQIDGLPAGLAAEWLIPEHADPQRVVFYSPGGGYISGSCADHRALVAKVAQGTGFKVLLFEYRLAPEHPFPAGMEDTLCAYRWLLGQGASPEKITIMGESAGGGLCLAALLAFRDQGLPLPASAVALSPWTDLKLTGASYRTKVKQCLSPVDMAKVCSKAYVGEHDPGHPWISPLYGDLRGMPPMLIYVGEYETMLDDSVCYAARAREAGVDVTLRVGEGMFHCYPLLAPLFPEATQALEEVCQFIQAH